MASFELRPTFIDEARFEPAHSDKAPLCDGCARIAYTVYQAGCCGAYLCETCKDAKLQRPYPMCNGKTGSMKGTATLGTTYHVLGPVSYDYNETHDRKLVEVFCRNKNVGCNFKDEIGRMYLHLSECSYELVKCKHDKCNRSVYRKDLCHHEDNCPDRLVRCSYCNDLLRSNHLVNYHLGNGCQKYPEPCPNKCGAKIIAAELLHHRKTCPCESLPCIFSKYGCAELVQRKNMDQHASSFKHMELLLKEIEYSRKRETDMQQAIQHSQKTEMDMQQAIKRSQKAEMDIQRTMLRSQKTEMDMQRTIQSLQTEVHSMKSNNTKALRDILELQEKNSQQHQQLVNKVNAMENCFKLHQRAFEDFKLECTITLDHLSQASITAPFRFIIRNIEELAQTGESQHSPCFYTDCRRHKLQLAVFPGGKDDDESVSVSVWLYRISNCGVPKNQLAERVKIQVLTELVSQLPNAIDADNRVMNIDTIVHRGHQDDLIYKKNDYIPIGDLDHAERRTRLTFLRHTQYKVDNCLVFLIRSAVEATM